MSRPGRYHRLSIAAKQAADRDSMREPAVACPQCETSTSPVDLVDHVKKRCTGHREPHPRSRWVTWREALEIGAQPGTLSKWVSRGVVRVRGERFDRQYLLRDLALRLVDRRPSVEQPRKFPRGNLRRKGWFGR